MKPFCLFALIAIVSLPGLAACGPSATQGERAFYEGACPDEDRRAFLAARSALESEALDAARRSRGAGSPALWTLSDEDTTIYLLGTVHLLRPGSEWQSEMIAQAVADADTVVFEADTASPEAQRALIGFYTSRGVFLDGTQLTGLLSEAERAELYRALESIGWPVGAIEPLRPWRAAIDLSVKAMLDEGFDPDAGVERMIEREAQKNGAEFLFLETVEDQLGGLASLDLCDQLDFLMATVQTLDDTGPSLDFLVDEWTDGDVDGISALMANPEMLGSEPVYRVMMTERNQRWVPQIAALLDRPGNVLIAVGAGHLAGDDSVIRMLRDEGYDVKGP